MNLCYKPDYLINSIQMNSNGYISYDNYAINCDNSCIYCDEVNIINKIKTNENGFFNFSKNMIDIGSCIGSYSFVLDFNHSYMFEANKKFCIISEMNMLLHNKYDKYTIYNELLSDKNESIQYNGFETEYSFGTRTEELGFYTNEIYNMNSSSLDSFDLQNIDFIKIDVEGMEEKVLRGGLGVILRNNYPKILFELWPINWNGMTKEKHDSLQKFLEDLGYKIFWEWGQFNTHLAVHKSQLK